MATSTKRRARSFTMVSSPPPKGEGSPFICILSGGSRFLFYHFSKCHHDHNANSKVLSFVELWNKSRTPENQIDFIDISQSATRPIMSTLDSKVANVLPVWFPNQFLRFFWISIFRIFEFLNSCGLLQWPVAYYCQTDHFFGFSTGSTYPLKSLMDPWTGRADDLAPWKDLVGDWPTAVVGSLGRMGSQIKLQLCRCTEVSFAFALTILQTILTNTFVLVHRKRMTFFFENLSNFELWALERFLKRNMNHIKQKRDESDMQTDQKRERMKQTEAGRWWVCKASI